MADVVLAHAYFLRFDPKQWQTMRPYPPLGTLFAAGYLRDAGYDVAVFDPMFAREPRAIVQHLERHRPRTVVFHEDNFNWLSKMCLTRMREAGFEMMACVKEVLGPEATIIVAGSDPTDHAALYLEKGADYCVSGESEHTLRALLDRLSGKSDMPISDIPGLIYLSEDRLIRTPARSFVKNLDTFGIPAWDVADLEPYRRAWSRHGYFSMNMVTTRGCPFKCNWCAKPIYGNRYNSRSPSHVAEELALLKNEYGARHIWFADDIFGLKPGWVEQFDQEVRARDAVTPYKIQARVDLLSEEVVSALRRSGCETAWVGAESGSQRVLDAMDKGTTVQQIEAATGRLKKHGIQVGFFLQFGYPGESDEDIEATVDMVRRLQPDDIGISVSYPLPGTKFYENVHRQMGAKMNWEHSDDLDLMFPGKYAPDFYRQLHRVIHREFRLKQAAATLARTLRRPGRFTMADLRQLLSSALRGPLLPLERRRLEKLRKTGRNPAGMAQTG